MAATHISDSQHQSKLRRALILRFLCVCVCVSRGAERMRAVTVGYISCRGTMHDKLCQAFWFVKRVLSECVSNADSAYFWGALKPPRGSFKHKLNFNCFVQDVSETAWMWGWDVCHCYSLMRQMVAGLIAAMTHSITRFLSEKEKLCLVCLKLQVSNRTRSCWIRCTLCISKEVTVFFFSL